MQLAVEEWAAQLWHDKTTRLVWGPELIAFLCDKVCVGVCTLGNAYWMM